MTIEWTEAAQQDLIRLYEFLAPVNPLAAKRILIKIMDGVEGLASFPHLGRPQDAYAGRDVRSFMAGDYEVHYELRAKRIVILRVWHAREDR
ncbi:type II toxin-antitoxin system RelE/ParE family toxin [Asticcacaulis machinosus]|uniref:Type II toxin-antitoxin system RelE/ParE family toxin n=1 Tax=Asticcacaulis machinosus TaxID=2984211 RepID=A0ABT5HGC8_9CAUL|nr:type II toxin-antitoxin system RelE/ParE family toxin [Asticcacaulis machinosus]MDC7675292.1 type II toxin-antitoxin system RelE/ParE family toxin [Asticcacaulis machinosus]